MFFLGLNRLLVTSECDGFPLGPVLKPETPVQHCGKGYPGPIWRHQGRRNRVDPRKEQGCGANECPEDDYLEQGSSNGMPAEEYPRPGEVQGQLYQKENQSPGAERGGRREPDSP